MKQKLVLSRFFRKIQISENRKFIKWVFVAIVFFTCFTCCTTINDTLYLRQAEVTESINLPPIHVTDSVETPSVYFSPRFTFQYKDSFTGEIEQEYYLFEADTVFIPSGKSLIWNMPSFNAGFDFDVIASRNLAISFGMNLSSQKNSTFVGGYAGIGFLGYMHGSGIRFDVGLQLHSVKYNAYTLVVREVSTFWGSNDTYTNYFHDYGRSTHIDPYFNFTYNTAFNDWPFNIFVNTGYSVQTLFSFTPRTIIYSLIVVNHIQTDARGESTAGFFHLTPGIYFYLGDHNRLLLGTRLFYETQVEGTQKNIILLPMMQVEIRL